MTIQVTSLWRHPIKAHGREEVSEVKLIPGQTMPGDRLWAVAHDAADLDGGNWVSCRNFTRAAGSPKLMAITAKTVGHKLTLSHPGRPELTFDPVSEGAAFVVWAAPLVAENRPKPVKLIEASEFGFTDSSWPSLTLCNLASHREVEAKLGRDLSIHRWRGNIWFDGLPAWEEFEWVGKHVKIGAATLKVDEVTTRCMATTANPDTGERDADTLGALKSWGHQDFSVKARVIEGGVVRTDDPIEVL